jgi:hypothetical protein
MSAQMLSYPLDLVQRRRPNSNSELRNLPFFASSTIKIASAVLFVSPASADDVMMSCDQTTTTVYVDSVTRSLSAGSNILGTTISGEVAFDLDGQSVFVGSPVENHADPLLFSVVSTARDLAPKIRDIVLLGELPRRLDRFSLTLLPSDLND